MATSNPTFVPEKTFTSYTAEQGAAYARIRPGYGPKLYDEVITQHTSTGGDLTTIMDVGCGPGIAIRALAPKFQHAIGIDPSAGMIDNARLLASTITTGGNEPIRLDVSSAEELGSNLDPAVQDGSVDLIVASSAAHWFDMSRFWPAAARVLKPGGTVALWSAGDIKIHPDMPNAVAIQAALDKIDERELLPFFNPGNVTTRKLYLDLGLPWTVTPNVEAFEKDSFVRKVWGPENAHEFFDRGALNFPLNQMELIMSTGSPVQRWREANPEKVGTEGDVLRVMRRTIERLLREVGVEEGKEMVMGSPKGVLLMVKKKA